MLTELFEKNPESNNDLLSASTSTENSQSLYDLDNSRENILQAKSIIEDKSESPSPSPLTIHPNRYQVLDSNSNFEDEFEKANVVCKYPAKGITTESRRPAEGITESRRPSNVVNPRPENDKSQYQQPNGNASYSNADRGILLLSDSMLGRIQLYQLNKELNVGRAIRK